MIKERMAEMLGSMAERLNWDHLTDLQELIDEQRMSLAAEEHKTERLEGELKDAKTTAKAAIEQAQQLQAKLTIELNRTEALSISLQRTQDDLNATKKRERILTEKLHRLLASEAKLHQEAKVIMAEPKEVPIDE